MLKKHYAEWKRLDARVHTIWFPLVLWSQRGKINLECYKVNMLLPGARDGGLTAKDLEGSLEVMEMFSIMTGMVVTWVNTFVKTH